MYIVTGFYTPNYSEMANTFRQNLDAHSIPHKIYPVERIGSAWIGEPLRKPSIVLQAMDEYPGIPIALMDVDCTVHGPIDELFASGADVSLYLRPFKGDRIHVSSRVIGFQPTSGSRQLLLKWKELCDNAVKQLGRMQIKRHRLMSRKVIRDNDEKLLLDAIVDTPNLTIRLLPLGLAGAAPGIVENAIITHESAHDREAPPRNPVLKSIRRKLVEVVTGTPYEIWRYGRSSKPWG